MSLNKTISIKYKKSNSTYHKLNFSFYLLIKPILVLSLSIYFARLNNGFNVFAQDVKQSSKYDKSDRDLFKKSPKKVTKKLINPGFKTQSSITLSGFNDLNDLINNPKRKVAIANVPTYWTTEILEKTESILKVHHPEITMVVASNYYGGFSSLDPDDVDLRSIMTNVPFFIKHNNLDIYKDSDGMFSSFEELIETSSLTDIELNKSKNHFENVQQWIMKTWLMGKYTNISEQNIMFFINHALHKNLGYEDTSYGLNIKDNLKKTMLYLFIPMSYLNYRQIYFKDNSRFGVTIGSAGVLLFYAPTKTALTDCFDNGFDYLDKKHVDAIFAFHNLIHDMFYILDEKEVPHYMSESGANKHLDYQQLMRHRLG